MHKYKLNRSITIMCNHPFEFRETLWNTNLKIFKIYIFSSSLYFANSGLGKQVSLDMFFLDTYYGHGRSQDFFRGGNTFSKNFSKHSQKNIQKIFKKKFKKFSKIFKKFQKIFKNF